MSDEKQKKFIDRKFRFLMSQVIVSVIVICFVIIAKVLGGDMLSYVKNIFNVYFNEKTNINQVLDADATKQVIAAQATAYGTGGDFDELAFIKQKDEISKEVSKQLSSSNINSMCIPCIGKITSEYGYRIHPISKLYLFHAGLDIGAKEGTDIKAVLDGTVIETDSSCSTSYGKYVKISHSNGVKTLYGHCSKILVKKGDRIKKGQVIAKVGSTGNSTGPHCHFEVRVNDIRLNPRWFIEI